MIPLNDSIRSHRTPWVTYALLALNIGIYILTSLLGLVDYDAIIHTYGLIPFRAVRSFDMEAMSDLVTSMFLHGSLLHLVGNMFYLWIFGDLSYCHPHPAHLTGLHTAPVYSSIERRNDVD